LTLQQRINFSLLLPLLDDTLKVFGFFGLLGSGGGGSLSSFGTLLRDRLRVVRLVPLSERSSVDLNDGALDEGVRADEFVVGGVVNNTDQPRFSRYALRAPCKVAGVEAEGAVLEVSTANANSVDTLRAKLGAGSLTAEFELSLLAVVGTLGTGGGTLVPGRAGNTYDESS